MASSKVVRCRQGSLPKEPSVDTNSDDNSDSDYDEKNEEDGDFMSTAKARGDREILTRSVRGSRNSEISSNAEKSKNDSESDDDDIVNMQPSAGNANPGTPKTRSLRKLHDKNDKVYIMDAKTCGNVGRYFNVSSMGKILGEI